MNIIYIKKSNLKLLQFFEKKDLFKINFYEIYKNPRNYHFNNFSWDK